MQNATETVTPEQAKAIWAEWGQLDDGCTAPVTIISTRLAIPASVVAGVVFPDGRGWTEEMEPEPYDPDFINRTIPPLEALTDTIWDMVRRHDEEDDRDVAPRALIALDRAVRALAVIATGDALVDRSQCDEDIAAAALFRVHAMLGAPFGDGLCEDCHAKAHHHDEA